MTTWNAILRSLGIFAIYGALIETVAANPSADGPLAPPAVVSMKIELNGIDATYDDDKGISILVASSDSFKNGTFGYKKTSAKSGQLMFKNLIEDEGVYSGVYECKFLQSDSGTFYKTYTGTFSGFISGTFRILEMEVPSRPLAKNLKFVTRQNTRKAFSLMGCGWDLPAKSLRYVIVNETKNGRLILGKNGRVTYVPKPGYSGQDTFKYAVVEGNVRSEPKLVKITVEKTRRDN